MHAKIVFEEALQNYPSFTCMHGDPLPCRFMVYVPVVEDVMFNLIKKECFDGIITLL